MSNVCMACGACCSSFRVSFYWAEANDAPGGSVPAELTQAVSPHLRCMQYDLKTHRCVALQGEVGKETMCQIYPLRSSTCREFMPFTPDGQPDPHCQKARAKHGLPPLTTTLGENAIEAVV